MIDLESCKKILTGIYTKNSELLEIDDSIFIQLIKAGAEEVSGDDSEILNALFDHLLILYTEEWIRIAIKDEEKPNLDKEREMARNIFLDYWYAKI